ncbi:hypothetical protein GIB67_022086 [Kingdonia uniflora]|uniref:Acyl-CoA oxidase n=1 Tax=Kingdonia uniflora TaxID=39325 RepID=A0A7J7MU94_9MAGN|nr:hypothetical protein GIB67_022086 [Kingdonia uniflora]
MSNLPSRCAMSFGANYLKRIYVRRTPEANKTIHVVSSAFKAAFSWHNMKTLQECREACGGQGLKTENRVGHLKGEHDVQSAFEGDNNVLMQQDTLSDFLMIIDDQQARDIISKALIGEYIAAQKRKKPFKGLALEHMNDPRSVIPSQLTVSTVRSSQFQSAIFCLRERDLLSRFATEVSQYQSQGESKENALILNVLGLLRSMYALISLEEDAAFLRYGYLSPENAAVIRKEVTKLCSELRPHALSAVKSFGIPDAFLSPIAFDWIAANSWSSKLQTQSSKSSNPSLNLEKETRKSSLGKRKERSEDETKDARSSVLIPINDKCSLTDALAMDCEMVGVSSLGNKSALGHVTLGTQTLGMYYARLRSSWEELSHYDSFIEWPASAPSEKVPIPPTATEIYVKIVEKTLVFQFLAELNPDFVADEEYFHMDRFYCMNTLGQHRREYLRFLAENAVTAEDEDVGVLVRKSRRYLLYYDANLLESVLQLDMLSLKAQENEVDCTG